ncbi:hypothetical protein PanWU01x14_069130 [Parasponia andersonii]|uniref:Uncharacterized protein n=1 Tax=Parasponia andersonii TaxID=3476 RepID=A0A2P5DFL4_PARAD|nr:hypothetical protein PanWU01x14_069130 [Parasponia andersonii]
MKLFFFKKMMRIRWSNIRHLHIHKPLATTTKSGTYVELPALQFDDLKKQRRNLERSYWFQEPLLVLELRAQI